MKSAIALLLCLVTVFSLFVGCGKTLKLGYPAAASTNPILPLNPFFFCSILKILR